MEGDIAQESLLLWNKEIRSTAVRGKHCGNEGKCHRTGNTGQYNTLRIMLKQCGVLDAHLFRTRVPLP